MTLLGEYIRKAIEEQADNIPITNDMNMMAGPLWINYRRAKEYGARCERDCQTRYQKNYMEKNLCSSKCQLESIKRQLTSVKSLITKCGNDISCRKKLTNMIEDLTKKQRRLEVRVRYYDQRARQQRMARGAVPRAIPGAAPGGGEVAGA